MLEFRGFINVAQFSVLAVVNLWRAISPETTPTRRRPEHTTTEIQPGNDRGKRSRQVLGQFQQAFKHRLLMFPTAGEARLLHMQPIDLRAAICVYIGFARDAMTTPAPDHPSIPSHPHLPSPSPAP